MAGGPSPAGGGPVPYLAPALRTVLLRAAEGATLRQIAKELRVSEVTARGYSARMQDALGACTLAHAVHRAHQLGMLDDLPKPGPPLLPPGYLEVLRLIAAGLSNSGIAATLGRPEYTVMDQVRRIRARLGARDRSHAVALAMAAGLLSVEDVLQSRVPPSCAHSA
ncbi:helix-turn-helix transcriptional regulator [Streptomyces sp. DH12]|uniref:helix-turn-helix transcriptional regulator n=1 Tax=Streptomyces sp. DH12 TaxID=2857010 RepID=UPI0027E0272B|nr:helix-turn-helix transcriptional regulator [Streptomyces sp. DH12]